MTTYYEIGQKNECINRKLIFHLLRIKYGRQLTLFGHVQHRPINVPIRKGDRIKVIRPMRTRGRPK